MSFRRLVILVIASFALRDLLFHAAGLPDDPPFTISWYALAELLAAIGIFTLLNAAVDSLPWWRQQRAGDTATQAAPDVN
jgi:hypothetical protein